MKKLILTCLIFAVFCSGCTGTFMLTKKVYNLHRQQEDKWTDELLFLCFTIIPVYGLATLGDAIVFNSIEFWTGDNPIEAKSQNKIEKVGFDDNIHAIMTYTKETDNVKIDAFKAKKFKTSLVLERNISGVSAKDSLGNIIYTATKDAFGGITIYDSNKKLVKYFSPEEISIKKQNFLNN